MSAKMVSVQVKEGKLRASPSFLARVLGLLSYGERLQVIETKKDWSKVSVTKGSRQGWIHNSALTSKKIILNPGEQDVKKAASSKELALAGKGFNKKVESEFKSRNKDIDFDWIDSMEKINISQNRMRQFLQKGGLLTEGEA